MDNFKLATKNNVRFKTSLGLLTTEQLWSAPDAELETLANTLEEQLKASGKKSYFTKKSDVDKLAQLKYDIVMEIIATKIEEREAASAAKETKQHNQKILDLIAKKQEDELGSKSVDELKALLK